MIRRFRFKPTKQSLASKFIHPTITWLTSTRSAGATQRQNVDAALAPLRG